VALNTCNEKRLILSKGSLRGRDRMVVRFTTTYAISAYHHWCFFQSPPVSSTNKTDCHDITKILLKVALNTIKQAKQTILSKVQHFLSNFVFTIISFLE